MKVLLKTFGCQQNDHDSRVAESLLGKAGYQLTDHVNRADVIIFNTCSVRQHAEERVFGQLTQLKPVKKKKPGLLIGVMGCMVENYREKFFADFPHVDFLIGTRSVRELPRAIERAGAERKKVMELAKSGFGYELYEYAKLDGEIHAYLPVMTGCDKVCSFCVVPYVRGREISRAPEEILDEIRRLADGGIKHVTLIGQNVNSYGNRPGTGMPFARLLREAAGIDGIEKIGFTTSHPQDAGEELFLAIRDHAKISRRFHLPLQSGSDKILKKMRRGHTLAEYCDKINRLRELVPDISITTDMIVGFPEETGEDYELSRQAMKEIQFDGAFIFKYSPRSHTIAAKWKDDVSSAEKDRRVNELLRLQRGITKSRNERLIGQTCRVMIEGMSKKSGQEVSARTWQEKKVVFRGEASEMGSIVTVRLKELSSETFRAERV
ncbi:MAG TPA: tRNA (N6-isopentenyl adenosine(37)-C2)-methylthiotransferase MiaB [Candidatus Omnitrophota bacterium]|nr:tRNA (N6-isopentenyl adenosine(37)-C2)-methylthiotransferase MiaB [Candidatus Omnitrophota bacterium]